MCLQSRDHFIPTTFTLFLQILAISNKNNICYRYFFHLLRHKSNINRYKKIKITLCIMSDHDRLSWISKTTKIRENLQIYILQFIHLYNLNLCTECKMGQVKK